MFRTKFVPFFIMINALNGVLAYHPPKVTLAHGGVLVGNYMTTVNGKIIHAYRGVPYAEPPVGQLRFLAPVSARSWIGERLATKDAPICPQKDIKQGINITLGSEDCLYLNVYTPEVRNNQRRLPVMVFIHGGSFSSGSGSFIEYRPGRIVDNNVILVTINYRLGALGFLSIGTADCPGNNGLKDQLMALKWVKKNIGAFRGNPRDVTLFGQSAGAVSVTHHMVSRLTKGLFHKAIIQSGTYFSPWGLTKRSIAYAQASKLGSVLGCPTLGKPLIECLRTKSPDQIISVGTQNTGYRGYPTSAFRPIIEPNLPGAFLTKNPRDVDIPHGASIPIIIGVTAEEGIFTTGPMLNTFIDEFIRRFDEVLPLMLHYNNTPQYIQEKITSKIDEFYFQGIHHWTKQNHQNLTNLFSDRNYYQGLYAYLRNRFDAKKYVNVGDTYVYLFDHKGSKSYSELIQSGPEYLGVSHGDELFCLFVFNNNGSSVITETDRVMKWAMPHMWANFARTGNPTPSGTHIRKWERAKRFPLKYAHIGNKRPENWTLLKNEVGLAERRMRFWRELEKKYL